jgi:ketosteroid isomerase-like protein
VVPEESTTPDLVALLRRAYEAVSRRDADAALSFVAPHAAYKTVVLGSAFEGHVAIRGFLEQWWGGYDEYAIEPEEILDLGNGVIFAVVIQRARVVGSSGEVRHRNAQVTVWENGLIVLLTNYADPDDARAAAERLAEERG